MAKLIDVINEAFNALDFAKDHVKGQAPKKTGFQLAELYGKMQDEIEAAKERGASDKEIKAIELKYQGKGLVLDHKTPTPSGKDFSNAGTELVQRMKDINATKKNLFKLMVYMCELTGKLGGPSKISTIKDTLDKLKKHADTLITYESNVSSKIYKPVGKKLRKDLDSIDLNELDWEDVRVPFTSDATKIKTGDFKNNNSDAAEKYAEIENVGKSDKDVKFEIDAAERDVKSILRRIESLKHIVKNNPNDEQFKKLLKEKEEELQKTFEKIEKLKNINKFDPKDVDVTKIKSVSVTGRARPNADIYEILQPYIHEFGRIAKKGQDLYDDFLADKGKSAPVSKKETSEEKQAREADYHNRRKLVKKIIDDGSDEEFEKNFNSFRNVEKAKDANKGSNFGQHANAMAKKNEDKLRKELGVEKEKVSNASGQSGDVLSLTKAFKGDKKKIFNAKFEDLKKKDEGSCVIYNIGQGVVDSTNALIIMAEKFLTDASATTTTSGAIFSSDELKNSAYINYNGQKFYMFKTDRNSPYAKMCKDPENKGFAESLDRKGGELKQKVKQIFSSSSVETDGPFNY